MATLFGLYPFLLRLYADGGYQGPLFRRAMAKIMAQVNVEIVKRSDHAKGFIVLPKRWVVVDFLRQTDLIAQGKWGNHDPFRSAGPDRLLDLWRERVVLVLAGTAQGGRPFGDSYQISGCRGAARATLVVEDDPIDRGVVVERCERKDTT